MSLRTALEEDADAVRRIARESLAASYGHALGDEVIEDAVEEWYGEGFASDVDDDSNVYLVAEDERPLGFAQAHLVGEVHTAGEIAWLHVRPDRRGEGYGRRLLERAEQKLADRGAKRLRGRVLAVNESGAEFYAAHGYEADDERTVEVGGETFDERTFVKPLAEARGEVPLEPREAPSGRTLYVAYDESDPASKGPLYATYADEDRTRRHGLVCGNCGCFDVAMDAMGAAECNDCGNERKPTRWDASYM